MPIPIEVCIDSLDSALAAEPYLRRGDRMEVCSCLITGGGLTPSIGLVHAIRRAMPDVDLMTMVRPRPGSFAYSDAELQTMLDDIEAFKAAGVAGVVLGCLTPDGQIDVKATRRLAVAAAPMQVTFHRAFDVTPDWKRALEDVATIPGVNRILTSGHMATALDGIQELVEMSRAVPSHITILPASGINAETLPILRKAAPLLKEAHLSSSNVVTPTPGPVSARGEILGFGRDEWRMNPKKLSVVRRYVDEHT